MRKKPIIPKILKIQKVEDFTVYCIFNNGELRKIDFKSIFKEWDIQNSPNDFRYSLLKSNIFETVQEIDGTLGWDSITKKVKLKSGKEFIVPFELDAAVLYDRSISEKSIAQENLIGNLLKKERKKAGLTQQELAKRSGTTRYYISRIENNRSDIELGTLRKIIEVGLDRQLEISVK